MVAASLTAAHPFRSNAAIGNTRELVTVPARSSSMSPFAMRAVAAIGMDRYYGSLTVTKESIVFAPTSRWNKFVTFNMIGRVVHIDRDVIVVRARLLPPNLNSSVILHGDPSLGEGVSAGVQLSAVGRRRLRPALVAAGFRVDERVTWFSMGGTGSRWEIPPPRA